MCLPSLSLSPRGCIPGEVAAPAAALVALVLRPPLLLGPDPLAPAPAPRPSRGLHARAPDPPPDGHLPPAAADLLEGD